MTLDAIDRAFIARWEQRAATGLPPASAGAGSVSAGWKPAATRETDDRALPAPARSDGGTPTAPDAAPSTPLVLADPGLVERLLAAGHDQWLALAAEVESARLAGHRVIAIAGGERGEGRTTLVACLARVLRDRGREVVVHASTADLATCPADGGRLHDKRIVLVDAGVWFPPGPIRRHRLLVASLGCDAAILVRRADRQPAPARETVLAAVGVTPLGEVLTFAPAACATASTSGAA
ncbi:MAG: hypothetical protein ACKOCX_07145 [Planctomycetota bacterium]